MRSSLTITILALLALPLAVAQPQLISDHPAVKTAVEQCLAEQTVKAVTSAKSGVRFATASPVFGGGYSLASPPVALRLNRVQFDEHDALQASLVVLPGVRAAFDTPIGLSVLWVHLESNYTRGTYAGRHVLLAGEIIPLQTYIFDGSEPSGLYALVVMVTDTASGQLVAMPGTHFVFRNFARSDSRGYLRVDSAETINDRYVLMKGNFVGDVVQHGRFAQFVLIGNQKFPILKADGATAIVDLGSAYALPAGVYDITLVIHGQGAIRPMTARRHPVSYDCFCRCQAGTRILAPRVRAFTRSCS